MSNRGRMILAGMAAIGLLAVVAVGPTTATAKSLASAMKSLTVHGDAGGCCYDPCIKYVARHKHHSVCCGCGCKPLTEVTLDVPDPATCDCSVEVSVCVPACCEGDPCVTSRCGVLGRRIVWYEWDCGFKARVVFNKHNEITVTSFGA